VNFAPAPSDTAVSLNRLIRDDSPPHLIPKAAAQISAPNGYASSETAAPYFKIEGYMTGHRSAPDSRVFQDLSNLASEVKQKHQLLSLADQEGGAKCKQF